MGGACLFQGKERGKKRNPRKGMNPAPLVSPHFQKQKMGGEI
jgi:hypothetical protein